jgi:urease gamma subunit
VNEAAMREAVTTLNRLIDEAARDGWKIELDMQTAYHWVGTGDVPRLALTISRPIRL